MSETKGNGRNLEFQIKIWINGTFRKLNIQIENHGKSQDYELYFERQDDSKTIRRAIWPAVVHKALEKLYTPEKKIEQEIKT